MNIPGFTAEASLFNSNMHYRAITEATVYGGIVQPAGPFSGVFNPFSNVFNPDEPVLSIFRPGWGNCLKRVCSLNEYYPGFPVWECRWVSAIC
jgi:hypothetical protein